MFSFLQLASDTRVGFGAERRFLQGFGFVTFSDESESEAAIAAMNDSELDGRRIKVK